MNRHTLRHVAAKNTKWLLGKPKLSRLEHAWDMTLDEWRQCQSSRLLTAYRFAREWTPYYRNRPQEYPDLAGDFPRLAESLAGLPVLRKESIREHNEEFQPAFWRLPTTVHTTSGSTGTPIRIFSSLSERALTEAALLIWYRRLLHTAVRPRVIGLSGFVKGVVRPVAHTPGGDHFINIYQLSTSNAGEYLRLLDIDRPTVITGYSSAIAELARCIEPLTPRQRANIVVVPTSEVLTPVHRAAILENLADRVYGQYGSQEGGHLALQCDAGRFHIHPYFGLIHVPSDGGTDLPVRISSHRRGMALFNFDLGDSVSVDSELCSCGLAWSAVSAISGRSEDLVITRDGRRIGYLLFHSTKNLSSVREAQLVQTDYERFTVNLVHAGDYNSRRENERSIGAELSLRLGYVPQIKFCYLDSIPREGPRAKFKAVVVRWPFD